MNPIFVTQRLKEALTRYLLTTFDVNRDGQNFALYQEIRKSLETDKALMTGPFLELAQPYLTGKTTHELMNSGVLSKRLQGLASPPVPFHVPLYLHQQLSAERIADGHSVIVSSGTGSGKTESFLLPILSDLLERPTKGVRALLIYPLNALVNDQLRRLSKTLEGTEISYGRYTSELEKTTREALKDFPNGAPPNQVISREQIRNGEKIPNILITNYAMLEYLLLRPEDSGLFAQPEDWKYIVLDEAHSYNGAKGIEVAYLIRRLKQRLGKADGEMVCIGTSATLTDNKAEAIDFAQTLFGETFTQDDIIFGKSVPASDFSQKSHTSPTMEAYLHVGWDKLLEGLRDDTLSSDSAMMLLRDWGVIDQHFQTDTTDTPQALYRALETNGHVRTLLTHMCENPDTPLGLAQAAELLFPAAQGDIAVEDAINALHHLVELCSYARFSPDSPSILPARYHLFARSPQGLWACLNPSCDGRSHDDSEQPWSKIFSSPRLTCDHCQGAVYPLVICRECGQVYVKTVKADGKYLTEPMKPDQQAVCYFVWSQVSSNEALSDDSETEAALVSQTHKHGETLRSEQATYLCLYDDCRLGGRCQCAPQGREPRKVALYAVVQHETKGDKSRQNGVSSLETCVRCKKSARFGDEIATDLTIAGSTPIAVLMTELYRELPASSEEKARRKPGEGRKLLSFYDSRQGAARYAAFLQDVFNQATYLRLVPEVVKAWHGTKTGDPLTFTDLSEKVMKMGWKYGVFQNTVEEDIDEAIGSYKQITFESLNADKKKLLKRAIQARLLAQLTTNYRSRQSLEALGLLTVRYFKTPPDVSLLYDKLGLSEAATRTLIYDLLDTLRAEKVITLPDGVEPKNEVFGNHTGHPRVVRGNPASNTSLTPWAGTTERHRRCRMVAQALKFAKRPHDLPVVQSILDDIFDWLIAQKPAVLDHLDDGSYRLAHGCLHFDAPTSGWTRCEGCQRLRHGESDLPCQRCGGGYQPVSLDFHQDNNYYRHIVKQPMYAMRVEEHTAQLAPEKGRKYQEAFKDGDINVLSCSTTFEMGIDLGDLQAVVMNNVPPQVSNYRQRAGRAGRRSSGTAFILTWAQERPHDQIYYERPTEIIRGQVRIPQIKLDNPQIRKRHLNALLLGDLLRYLKQNRGDTKTTGAFFDPQSATGRHYDYLNDWTTERQSNLETAILALAHMSRTSLSPSTVLKARNVHYQTS